MRYSLFTIALFFLFTVSKAQCPAGAGAGVVFYMHQIGLGSNGLPIIDTSNTFYVSNFQPNTTVYFYNNYNTFIDSVITLADGSGSVNLSPSLNDSIWPAFGSGFTSLGIATNGVCITGVGGVALLPVKISKFTVANNNNTISINWQTEMDEPGIKYIVQQSENGISFTDLIQVVSTSSNIGRYSYLTHLASSKTKYFRIKIVNNDGRFSYTETKTIELKTKTEIVSYSIGHTVYVSVPINFIKGCYFVYNAAGSLLASEKIVSESFVLSSNTGTGICFVKFTDINGRSITKSFIISD